MGRLPNDSIQELKVLNNTSGAALELNKMLKINTALRSLCIFEIDDKRPEDSDKLPSAQNAELIADGIRYNKGIKSLDIFYPHLEGIRKIFKAVQDNQSLVHFIDGTKLEEDDFNAGFINNKNLTQFQMKVSDSKEFGCDYYSSTDFNALSNIIKTHPNLPLKP